MTASSWKVLRIAKRLVCDTLEVDPTGFTLPSRMLTLTARREMILSLSICWFGMWMLAGSQVSKT
jgi:hypothetical protein